MTASPELSRGELGLLRALHRDRDERQWQRVLRHALEQDFANVRAFAEGVLHSASKDPTSHRRALNHVESLPPKLLVSSEQRLHRTAGRGSRALGSADLMLRSAGAEDWIVLVELKLMAGYGHQQLARYLEHGRPVLAVVCRRGAATAQEVSQHPGWLGEAEWQDLVPTLRGFSWPRGGGEMWLAMLEGMRSVFNDPPSFEEEIHREHDLARRLQTPLDERVRSLVAAHVSLGRAALVMTELHDEGDESDQVTLVVTSGPADEADEALLVSPLYEGPELRMDVWWVDARTATSRPRSLRELHRDGFEVSGKDSAHVEITISPGEIEATDDVTAALEAITPALERVIAHWRHRRAPKRRPRRRQ